MIIYNNVAFGREPGYKIIGALREDVKSVISAALKSLERKRRNRSTLVQGWTIVATLIRLGARRSSLGAIPIARC